MGSDFTQIRAGQEAYLLCIRSSAAPPPAKDPPVLSGEQRSNVSHVPQTGLLPCSSSPASSSLCPPETLIVPPAFWCLSCSGLWAEMEGLASSPTRDTLCHVVPTLWRTGASLPRLLKANGQTVRNVVNALLNSHY